MPVDPRATQRFQDRQHQLLKDTYRTGWHAGVANYLPDPDPVQPANPSHEAAIVGVGLASILLQRRRKPYVAPTVPDDDRMVAALKPATDGLARMVHQINAVIATQDDLDAARAAVQAGTVNVSGAPSAPTVAASTDAGSVTIDAATEADTNAVVQAYAESQALQRFMDTNQWRLYPGESVAWAGEQAGYQEAADADGMLLEWQTEADDHVCEDCADLGTLPPMPAGDWPTTPGQGDTECNVGCRCSLQASADLPGGELPDIDHIDQIVISRIASRALAAAA